MNNPSIQRDIIKSGVYSVKIEVTLINPESLLTFHDKEKFDNLCKEGCGNYGKKWSCPPFSPDYPNFSAGYKNLWIVMLYFQMDQFESLRLEDKAKISIASRILKTRIDMSLERLAYSYGCYISAGSCRLCRTCKKEENLPCIKPEKMSYSYEAMGIDVGQLCKTYFNHELQWFENGKLPQCTTTVGGLLTNSELEPETIIDAFRA